MPKKNKLLRMIKEKSIMWKINIITLIFSSHLKSPTTPFFSIDLWIFFFTLGTMYLQRKLSDEQVNPTNIHYNFFFSH